jgi:hypothetical protein
MKFNLKKTNFIVYISIWRATWKDIKPEYDLNWGIVKKYIQFLGVNLFYRIGSKLKAKQTF